MKKTLLLFITLFATVLLVSCGGSNKNEIRGGGQHVCSEARAKQAGLSDYMNRNALLSLMVPKMHSMYPI